MKALTALKSLETPYRVDGMETRALSERRIPLQGIMAIESRVHLFPRNFDPRRETFEPRILDTLHASFLFRSAPLRRRDQASASCRPILSGPLHPIAQFAIDLREVVPWGSLKATVFSASTFICIPQL